MKSFGQTDRQIFIWLSTHSLLQIFFAFIMYLRCVPRSPDMFSDIKLYQGYEMIKKQKKTRKKPFTLMQYVFFSCLFSRHLKKLKQTQYNNPSTSEYMGRTHKLPNTQCQACRNSNCRSPYNQIYLNLPKYWLCHIQKFITHQNKYFTFSDWLKHWPLHVQFANSSSYFHS